MYKVIIVDDEMLIRKRLIYGFPWEELGYQIQDEAENGQQALALMEEKQYQLAIIDIAMPGINGIELAKKMRERQYKAEIIFLTGHSDFQYAKQAVQYGVYYYILKPINEEEFLAVLKKLRQKIHEEISREVHLRQLERKQDHMDAVILANFFGDYLHGLGSEEAGVRIFDELMRAGFKQGKYHLAILRVEGFLKDQVPLAERMCIVEEACRAAVSAWCSYYPVCDTEEDCVLLFIQMEEYKKDQDVLQEVCRVAMRLKVETDEFVRCGVSRVCKSFSAMSEAYVEALSALNNAKMLQEEVVAYQETNEPESVLYKISSQEMKELHAALMGNQYEECRKTMKHIFHEMEVRRVTFECVVRNVNRLLIEFVDAGVVSDMDTKRLLRGHRNVERALGNMENLGEIEEWCENVVYTFMQDSIRVSCEGKSLPIVEKTCEYIRQNYMDAEMTQSQISEAMGVTSSYLSGIFKKTMGISMVRYITMFRMEKAREMLLQSGKDIWEIAEQVGYHDEYYFSRCFKKQYGFSPIQMRKLSDARRIRYTEKKQTI